MDLLRTSLVTSFSTSLGYLILISQDKVEPFEVSWTDPFRLDAFETGRPRLIALFKGYSSLVVKVAGDNCVLL